jgi:hypothetical protein
MVLMASRSRQRAGLADIRHPMLTTSCCRSAPGPSQSQRGLASVAAKRHASEGKRQVLPAGGRHQCGGEWRSGSQAVGANACVPGRQHRKAPRHVVRDALPASAKSAAARYWEPCLEEGVRRMKEACRKQRKRPA